MTNSPPLDSKKTENSVFSKLHPGVQRWVRSKNWTSFRDVQAKAISPILSGNTDLMISAPTAGGKTEAAFMPIASVLAETEEPGILCLCLSPLKALINDQYERLTELFEHGNIPVHMWHGDVRASKKKKILKDPAGVLIITPESMEAMFIRRGSQLKAILGNLKYLVVDEFRAFIGNERGKQLQSLLHRIELCVRRRIPRIALSATLGNMEMAAEHLRYGEGKSVQLIADENRNYEILLQLRGYVAKAMEKSPDNSSSKVTDKQNVDIVNATGDLAEVAEHLFKVLRGKDNLIFANSRSLVEIVTDMLRRKSERERVPVEFFPHHGNLSKELREEAEALVKDKSRPGNIVCTSTLELGVDIGSVFSIAQIGCPPSVASMRQRLGRSGRRKGETPTMRVYSLEKEITPKTNMVDTLRPKTVQSIAMINLLLDGWNEPPQNDVFHFSTLVQQTLSMIAQYGGIQANEAWQSLCKSGAFRNVSQENYATFLRALASADLITQTHDGLLVLGRSGESLVDRFDFYAAFKTPQEYRLVATGRTIGSIPIGFPIFSGMYLIFAGRRWLVETVDSSNKAIYLVASRGGRPPVFPHSSVLVSDEVRNEMYRILCSNEIPSYLNKKAQEFLAEGRQNFKRLQLDATMMVQNAAGLYLFPWLGDRILSTLLAWFKHWKIDVFSTGVGIGIIGMSEERLKEFVTQKMLPEKIDALELAQNVEDLVIEKFDRFVPDELLRMDFAEKNYDVYGARAFLKKCCELQNGQVLEKT